MKTAIVIDSKARTVTKVTKEWNLADLQEAVGGYIDAVYLDNETTCFVNDEGLLHLTEESMFFKLANGFQPLAGNGVILEVNDEGDSVSVKSGREVFIQKAIKFYTLEEIQGMFSSVEVIY